MTDEEPKRYPCETIDDMARIPEEALPRFLAELPNLIATVRQMEAINRMFTVPPMIRSGADWVDDRKHEIHPEVVVRVVKNGSAP